jgi:hypothetical protein
LADDERNGIASLAPATHSDPRVKERLAKLRARQRAEAQNESEQESEIDMFSMHRKSKYPQHAETIETQVLERPESLPEASGPAPALELPEAVPVAAGPNEHGKKKSGKKAKAPKAPKTTKQPKTKKDKPSKEKKAKPDKVERPSLLNMAAQVLAAAKKPMNAKELVEEVKAKKLWESPAGKTPHATLSAAIMKEIATKGKDSRFRKVSPGHWEHTGK